MLASVMQCLERHDTPAVFGWVCVLFCIGLSVVVSGGVTPGPFPNPEAKPTCADGTAPGRVWESKSPPALKLKMKWGVGRCNLSKVAATHTSFFYALTHCGGKVGVNSKRQQHCASAASETKIDKVHGTGPTTRKDEDDGR